MLRKVARPKDPFLQNNSKQLKTTQNNSKQLKTTQNNSKQLKTIQQQLSNSDYKMSSLVNESSKDTFYFLLWLQKLPVEIWMEIIEFDPEKKLKYMFYNSIITLPKMCSYVHIWKNDVNELKYGSIIVFLEDDYEFTGEKYNKSICWTDNSNGKFNDLFKKIDGYIPIYESYFSSDDPIYKFPTIMVEQVCTYVENCQEDTDDFYECFIHVDNRRRKFKGFTSEERYTYGLEEKMVDYYSPLDFVRLFDCVDIEFVD